MTPVFERGNHVRIHGLVARPELNGCAGVIVGGLSEGRYPVLTSSNLNAFRIKPDNLAIDSAVLVDPTAVFAAFFTRASAYDVRHNEWVSSIEADAGRVVIRQLHARAKAELERVGRKWSTMGFLQRRLFFVAVRAARGQWPDDLPVYAGPDALLLDMFEQVALGCDGERAYECFVGTANSECGAVQILASKQDFWYKTLEDRELPLARQCFAEKPSKVEMQEMAMDFCLWFARYATRFLEAIERTPELVVSSEALVIAHGATRRLSAAYQGQFAATAEHARLARAVHDSCRSSTVAFVKVERLKIWAKAVAEDAAGRTDGRVVSGTNYRPFALQVTDVTGGRSMGQVFAASMQSHELASAFPQLEAFWLVEPTAGELLTVLLTMLSLFEMKPGILAFDSNADEHALALSSFLLTSLGIRCTSSSLEHPLLAQDEFDEQNAMIYDEAAEDKSMHSSPFQWKAAPLLEIEGLSVDALAQFHGAAAAYSRSKAWGKCRVKLGVLIPGSPWRLGVPLGWSGTCWPGFAVDEYTSPGQPEPMKLGAMPAFMLMDEYDAPFSDVEAAEKHGFQVDEEGKYAVPMFTDEKSALPHLHRPSALLLKWITNALPAVTAFIDKHGLTKAQTASHLHERFESSITYVNEETGVVVCWPPPSPEWMPDRGDIGLNPKLLEASARLGVDLH